MPNPNITPELDELSSDLMGAALDLLAEGEPVNVLLSVQDEVGTVSNLVFADDGEEECLIAAKDRVRELVAKGGDGKELKTPVRYAICYEGAIADETGAYYDAVLLEFGERGYTSWSAYSLIEGRGEGDDFRWTEPAPAGEVEALIV